MKVKPPPKRGKGERPPKSAPAENYVIVHFSDAQFAEFLNMYEQSGVRSKARFYPCPHFWRSVVRDKNR